MRVSEDRYVRDLRRINLAQRLIRHEVRTKTICTWTGISDERVRNLVRSYEMRVNNLPRHRGPAPTRTANFIRSPSLRSEASAIAGLAHVQGILPPVPVPAARRTLPGIEIGERLCSAFELYRQLVPAARLSMDQFILLVLALAEGIELRLGHCPRCQGTLLMDRLTVDHRACLACTQAMADKAHRALVMDSLHVGVLRESGQATSEAHSGFQHSLF